MTLYSTTCEYRTRFFAHVLVRRLGALAFMNSSARRWTEVRALGGGRNAAVLSFFPRDGRAALG